MNNAAADTSTRPIKKNKKLNAKSYLALFSTPQQTAKSPPAPGMYFISFSSLFIEEEIPGCILTLAM